MGAESGSRGSRMRRGDRERRRRPNWTPEEEEKGGRGAEWAIMESDLGPEQDVGEESADRYGRLGNGAVR